mmetsp:Transcript_63757/g.197870  ORF Transcript_63757/g.197870 Transcript_63757/m.197870 type:complete len:355 (+) Transcript_63757:170-1234(+)
MMPRMVSPRWPMTEPKSSVGTSMRSSPEASCFSARSSTSIRTARARCSSGAEAISTTRSEASKGGESASFICTLAKSRSLMILFPRLPTIQAASSLATSSRMGTSLEPPAAARGCEGPRPPPSGPGGGSRSSKCSGRRTPPWASSASTPCTAQTAPAASSASLPVTRTRFWSTMPAMGSFTTWMSQRVSSMRPLIRSPFWPMRCEPLFSGTSTSTTCGLSLLRPAASGRPERSKTRSSTPSMASRMASASPEMTTMRSSRRCISCGSSLCSMRTSAPLWSRMARMLAPPLPMTRAAGTTGNTMRQGTGGASPASSVPRWLPPPPPPPPPPETSGSDMAAGARRGRGPRGGGGAA